MSAAAMLDRHQWSDASTPWSWALAGGRAWRLEALPVARWLVVAEGRVWLTRTQCAPEADDHWLEAGERLLLEPGSRWVVEASPHARVVLMLQMKPAPARHVTAGGGAALSAWLRSWRSTWSALMSRARGCQPRPA